VEAAEPSADVDTQPTSTLLFWPARRRRIRQPVGTVGEQPAWMTKNARRGGVEREHPKVNRVFGHGHGGKPDTAGSGEPDGPDYWPA
jgi:hypothetical protein